MCCLLFAMLISYHQLGSAKVTNLSLERISVEHGLSQSSIKTMIQDSEGFVWIGTENGLNLYDGYSFRVLPGPNDAFSNQDITKVIQGKNGLIWINVTGLGLYSYNKNNDQYQLVVSGDLENKNYHIADITEGDNNTLYIASAKTIIRYNKQTQQLTTLADLSTALDGLLIINSVLHHDNTLFIATPVGVYALNTQTKQLKKLPAITKSNLIGPPPTHSADATRTYNLHVSAQKHLYFGTNNGVYKVDIANIDDFINSTTSLKNYRTVIEGLPSWTFYADKDSLYIGSHLGLSRVSTLTDNVENLFGFNDVYDHLNNNIVMSMFKDNQGVFWLGSNTNGIFKWNPSHSIISNYRYKKSSENSLSDNLIWSATENKSAKDEVWLGTANGLSLVNLTTKTTEQFLVEIQRKDIYSKSYIYQIQQDNNNQLWIRNAVNMQLFDTLTKKIKPMPFATETLDLFTPEVWLFYIDTENYGWVLTTDGLNRINLDTGEFTSLDFIDQTIGDNNIFNVLGFLPNTRTMLISTNDTLWGADLKTNTAKKLYTFPNVSPTEWSYFDSWAIDKNNIIWLPFVTKGLVGLDATSFELKHLLDKTNSTIDLNNYSVFSDSEGDIWFSSHNGLFVLYADSLHLRNFNLNDGIGAREFNSGASAKHSNGKLIYGSINGISVFDPLTLKRKQAYEELTLHLTNIEILSREANFPFMVDQQTALKVQHDDIGIKIAFSPLVFSHQQNMVFEFKLIGKKEVTYPITTDNYITFPTLPSGEHELQVRLKSPFTGEFSKPTSLLISVGYAPWASPTAYVIYFLLALLLFLYWLNSRRKYTQVLINAHEQVQQREQRLSLALRGSNSAVWDWLAEDNMIFAKRVSNDLGYKNIGDSYLFSEHLKLIHNNDREAFSHQWQEFIRAADLNDSFSCTYRMQAQTGEWLWFKDLGKIVAIDQRGNPTRITGSYTNITESRAEAEKAQYYGEAFKQTKEWVFIISENFTRIVVNKSLQDALGWRSDDISFDDELFGLNSKRRAFYRRLFNSLNEHDHWRGEEIIYAKTGEEYHVLLTINVNRNQTTDSLHFVCIATDITAQKQAENELRYLANYDHLTDLPNRALLLERINHAMEHSARFKQSVALFFIDLDRFKKVNDSLGHDQGDILLQEITRRLKKVLRVDDTVARIGGDEFVILLESFRGNSQLSKIAQKVIKEVNEPVILQGNMVTVGASIGIALYPEDAGSSEELLKNADVAMYHAKQIGRNTFQFYTPRMNVEASQRLKIEASVKYAHEHNEFINYYQPIVNSSTGKAIGVELLLRWKKDNKLILPGKFISVAEELNLIIPMTEQALERGLQDLKIWHQYRKDMFLSVNLSAQHFSIESLVTHLTYLLDKYQLPASVLKLEITESILISDPQKAIHTMETLAKMGVELAIDDFGTGYSSLNYLKRLPLHSLKIDRCFIQGIGFDKKDEAIVDATLVLAKNLDMHCIAEGVETTEQLNYLAQRKCYAIQGFLYSKPISSDKVEQFLIENKQEITAN